jgi:hypothetical protein
MAEDELEGHDTYEAARAEAQQYAEEAQQPHYVVGIYFPGVHYTRLPRWFIATGEGLPAATYYRHTNPEIVYPKSWL